MKRWLDNLGAIIALAIAMIGAAYLMIPLILAVSMSFDARDYLGPFPPTEFSLKWYRAFFASADLINGFYNSVVLAFSATAVSTVTGVAAATALHRFEYLGKNFLLSLFLSPLMVPAVVIGFGLLVFFSQVGVLDSFIRLLCGHVVITLPYIVRATLAGLTGIPPTLREAALSLGANERQAFWDITFPLAKTGIFAGCVMALALSFDDVAVSLFLYDFEMQTLPIALLSQMRASFDLTVAVSAVLLTAISLVLIILLDRLVGLDHVVGRGIYNKA